MAIALYDKASGKRLFPITEAQRDQLVDALEEESTTDHDYYIDAAVCDFLDGKVDAELLTKLRGLCGADAAAPAADLEAAGDDEPPPALDDEDDDDEGDGVEIEWREE